MLDLNLYYLFTLTVVLMKVTVYSQNTMVMYLKTENYYLKIFVKIYVGKKVCENT